MNGFQLSILMREAQDIIDSFKKETSMSTDERRLAAKYQQIQFLSAELELLDRLVSMLEAGVAAMGDDADIAGTVSSDLVDGEARGDND